MIKNLIKSFLLYFVIINTYFFLTPYPAYAYLGPGIGGGILAATLGVVVAILAAIFGLIWFPLKRFLKERKKKKEEKNINFD
tara:strand:- start:101 stop:346 length:246 start_codon:yes stop_codon:yes gene_type:complete